MTRDVSMRPWSPGLAVGDSALSVSSGSAPGGGRFFISCEPLELSAVMRAVTLVFHERATVTQRTAATQVLVEPVDDVDPVLQLAQEPVPQRGLDDAAHVTGRC